MKNAEENQDDAFASHGKFSQQHGPRQPSDLMVDATLNWTPPDSRAAAEIAHRFAGREVSSVHRFATGLCHYVFDVAFDDASRAVVRIARPECESLLVSAVYWHDRLKALGVPVASILEADHGKQIFPYAYLVIERLDGSDLGEKYEGLSPAKKIALADEVVGLQRKVAELPRATGFGFSTSYESGDLRQSWTDVVRAELAKGRRGMASGCLADQSVFGLLEAKLNAMGVDMAAVRPHAFLDDVTTKNVIVGSSGRLSGIVDVDCVCFGDSLFTLGLTRAALASIADDTIYVDRWTESLHLNEGGLRRLAFYTALFCALLLSEHGQSFNRDGPILVSDERRRRLKRLYDDEIRKLPAP